MTDEWHHARIEGVKAVGAVTARLCALLEEAGYAGVVPATDERFKFELFHDGEIIKDLSAPSYNATVSWSERHAAYVCGLGTFGLSRGLITKRGVAGCFASIITDMPLEPDARPYSSYDEHCNRCGLCGARCSVKAIDVERGKDLPICRRNLRRFVEEHSRMGCLNCYTDVPCMKSIPSK
jgi:epoxyqueuosine reductase QueG